MLLDDKETQDSGYSLNWETTDARIKELKSFLLEAPQKMDPQRLEFLMQVYEDARASPSS